MKVDDFLSDVYVWLMKPMNESVYDYHEACALTMGKKHFTNEIEGFLTQRFVQTYPTEEINQKFIHRCAVEYVKGMWT